jgi:hypothetical protein
MKELIQKKLRKESIFIALVLPDALPPLKQRVNAAFISFDISDGTFELNSSDISTHSLKQKKFFAPNDKSIISPQKRTLNIVYFVKSQLS